MRRPSESPRQKAIRAARAVTLGGVLLASGCAPAQSQDNAAEPVHPPTEASDQESQPETPAPTSSPSTEIEEPTTDGSTAPATDGSGATVIPPIPEEPLEIRCRTVRDNICPSGCSIDEDVDCCREHHPEWEYDSVCGCGGNGCAIEGPFAPPSMIG